MERCLVLEHYDTGHSAVAIRDKIKALLAKYGLSHCSATILDSTEDEDMDANMLTCDAEGEEDEEEEQGLSDIQLVFTSDNAPAMVAALDGEQGW